MKFLPGAMTTLLQHILVLPRPTKSCAADITGGRCSATSSIGAARAMRKTPRNKHKAPLLPIPVESAFERLAVDVMGPFPPLMSGNRYAVVFTDYLTKWTEAFPVPTIGADVIARLLVEEILP